MTPDLDAIEGRDPDQSRFVWVRQERYDEFVGAVADLSALREQLKNAENARNLLYDMRNDAVQDLSTMREQLAGLVERWRAQASEADKQVGSVWQYVGAKRVSADELEALLHPKGSTEEPT